MDEETWKHIKQILKELEDEDGFVTFPVTGEFKIETYTFYTDDVLKIFCEELDPIDVKDTSLAQEMLKQIGVKS
jgi:hypothetical protein